MKKQQATHHFTNKIFAKILETVSPSFKHLTIKFFEKIIGGRDGHTHVSAIHKCIWIRNIVTKFLRELRYRGKRSITSGSSSERFLCLRGFSSLLVIVKIKSLSLLY